MRIELPEVGRLVQLTMPRGYAEPDEGSEPEEWQFGTVSQDGGPSFCAGGMVMDGLLVGVVGNGPECSELRALARTVRVRELVED